jgi:ABC-type uncharacterized transport system permease subunit
MAMLLPLGAGLFGLCTLLYLGALWRPMPALSRAAHLGLSITVGVSILVAGQLAVEGEAGTARFWMSLSSGALAALFLGLRRHYPIDSLGSFVAALSTLLAVFAAVNAPDVAAAGHALPPGVHAWLLPVHVGLAFVGITAFAFSTAVSVVYLLQARMLKQKSNPELRRRLPPLDVLDGLALRGVLVGFPLYTVALLLGSVEALRMEHLRAAYLVALVSWVVYAVVLQARLAAGWRGRRAATLTAVGLLLCLGVVAQYALRGA